MRCIYCNKKSESLKIAVNKDSEFYYCSDECKDKAIEFRQYEKESIKFFYVGFVVLPILAVVLAIVFSLMENVLLSSIMFGLVFLLMGLSIFKFPFLTPQSEKKRGIKKSIQTGRNIGVIFMVAAPIISFFMWFFPTL